MKSGPRLTLFISLFFLASRLGTDGSWAHPVVANIEAALKHGIDHSVSANSFSVNGNASCLPSISHLFLAMPLISDHDAIVRWLVHVQNVV